MNKLFFTTKAVLYAGIEPKANRDPAQADSPVVSGFRIARQNCFRCHNSGEFGGTQSGVSWKKLERLAHSRPAYFAAWIYDPKLLDPKARMPANRNYDKATRVALTKYFAEMAVEGQ
jgi:mono/diheme cytochrome c family protein